MSAAQDLALQVQAIQQQYAAGQLSPQDFKELINDMNLVNTINENAATFEMEQEARAIILGALQIASAIY
jgi:hypothetical protein